MKSFVNQIFRKNKSISYLWDKLELVSIELKYFSVCNTFNLAKILGKKIIKIKHFFLLFYILIARKLENKPRLKVNCLRYTKFGIKASQIVLFSTVVFLVGISNYQISFKFDILSYCFKLDYNYNTGYLKNFCFCLAEHGFVNENDFKNSHLLYLRSEKSEFNISDFISMEMLFYFCDFNSGKYNFSFQLKYKIYGFYFAAEIFLNFFLNPLLKIFKKIRKSKKNLKFYFKSKKFKNSIYNKNAKNKTL